MSRSLALGALLLAFGACEKGTSRPDLGPREAPPGRLHLTSTPGGAAVLEGEEQRLGQTPLTIERPAMTRVELQLVKEGYEIHRLRPIVESGRTIHLHAELRAGSGELIIRAGLIRGAVISVDGEVKGKTPLRLNVTAGVEHRVRVERDGLVPFEQRVTIVAGETREIDAELLTAGQKARPSGWLSVTTRAMAMVALDGVALGSTPLKQIRLPARAYRLTVTNPATKASRSQRVVIKAGETTELSIDLE